ncbi:ATP-dependent DNA helicase pif1-like [Gigaspora margarita]|uniref:ATP-dependent DNA helicase pif1-like n=1 Tax=Gigaspora margarita TaxID=4874 RepID=A0A8H4EP84_GIGMA|nr:ATP-dependent DNA helicase pif1-like [Gigaspora margarita]
MQKHKRIYMSEQKATRNDARRTRLALMMSEEQLSHRNNESTKRQDQCKQKNTINKKKNTDQNFANFFTFSENQNILALLFVCQLFDNNHNILKKFCNAVSALKFNFCPICNEKFPTIVLVNTTGLCYRYNNDKLIPNQFLAKNDMDPGEIPIELL